MTDQKKECGETASYCVCREPAGHYPETPHKCEPSCGGSWRGVYAGPEGSEPFMPITFPGEAR